MRRLLPLTSVTTTSVAFAALCAGAGVANTDADMTPANCDVRFNPESGH